LILSNYFSKGNDLVNSKLLKTFFSIFYKGNMNFISVFKIFLKFYLIGNSTMMTRSGDVAVKRAREKASKQVSVLIM
jgi:hypothetical protein